MEKSGKKQKWSKPQLIVIVKGTVEERVLDACKTGDSNTYIGGSNLFFFGYCEKFLCGNMCAWPAYS